MEDCEKLIEESGKGDEAKIGKVTENVTQKF
jgi:hypothetical protein